MAKQVGGFVLTIESDDEDNVDTVKLNEKDSEEKNRITNDSDKSKKKMKHVRNGLVWKDVDEEAVDQDKFGQIESGNFEKSFIFDETGDSDNEVNADPAVIESWDFTKTIQQMRAREHPAQKVTTSLDEKIRRTLEKRKGVQKPNDYEEAESENESEIESSETDQESNKKIKRKALSVKQDEAEHESHSESESEDEEEDVSNELGQNSVTLQRQKARLLEQQKHEVKYAPVSFVQLNLSRSLMRATQVLGFESPTPIQAKAIPYAMAGRDVCGSAVTGSGKTAAYLLPILERLLYRPKRVMATRVLIVTPTRELAQQVLSMMEKLAQFTDIKGIAIVGGLNSREQANELRARPDVVVATPGRLIDHVRNTQSVDLDNVEILVLDEADRLLELGFQEEVMELVKFCPKGRQTMLFSATMTTSVNNLVDLSLNRPVKIEADPLYDMANRLTQEFVRVKSSRENDREAMLLSLVTRSFKSKSIIFFRRKFQTHRMGIIFGLLGLKAAELHGNLTQTQRLESLQRFRDGKVDFLLCTDLASRGIDIVGIENVINFEMPKDLATYVHRVGRTARAGRGGQAVTLASEKYRMLTKEVLKRSKHNVKSRTIPDKIIGKMHDKIDNLENEIKDVLEQEKVEKQIRLAEMEANKATNMIDHREEIMSRPAKTWFQTNQEKEAIKQAARELLDPSLKKKSSAKIEESSNDQAKEKVHRLSRKKRRRLEAEKAEAQLRKEKEADLRSKAEERGEEADEEAIRLANVSLKTKALAQAKAKKRKARGADAGDEPDRQKFNDDDDEENYDPDSKPKKKKKKPANASSVAISSMMQKSSISKKARFGGAELAGFEAELAPGEALSLLDARHNRKKKSDKDDALVFKERDLSKGGLRKGGKLGNKKFKSKAKYKRR